MKPVGGVMAELMPAQFAPLGVTRSDDHVYSWNDGQSVVYPLAGVTSIIKVIDKSGPFIGWATRIVAEAAIRERRMLEALASVEGDDAAIGWLKKIPASTRDQAGNRGVNVHQIAEQIVRGFSPDVPEELIPYVANYRKFLAEWTPTFTQVEQMVVSLKYGYGGTFDAIARIGNEKWLLDIKTSTGTYSETALQLAAYGGADFIGRPGDPQRYAIPRVQRYGVIHVTDQVAELVPYAVDRDTFKAFLRCREVWSWTQNQAKTVIGKPLTREGENHEDHDHAGRAGGHDNHVPVGSGR